MRRHGRPDAGAGQPDPEAGIDRNADRAHPDDGKVEAAIGQRHAAGRLGRDDERLMAAGDQVLRHAHRSVRDAVDIGREGL